MTEITQVKLDEMLETAQFLIERLDDFERGSLGDDIEDACRDFDGHVVPAIARLRATLASQAIRSQGEDERVLKDVTTEWVADENAGTVKTHSRMVDGVLCRWWGAGPAPAGVAKIDQAASTHPAPQEAGDVKGMESASAKFAAWQHAGSALAAAAGCTFTLKVRSPTSTWEITSQPRSTLTEGSSR